MFTFQQLAHLMMAGHLISSMWLNEMLADDDDDETGSGQPRLGWERRKGLIDG